MQILRLRGKMREGYSGCVYFYIKGAYNAVNRNRLMKLFRKDFPEKVTFMTLLSNLLEENKVFLDNFYVKANRGVPQGAIISPALFNLYLQEILENMQTKLDGKLKFEFW